MKDVASASGVCRLDAKGRCVVKLRAIVSQNAFGTECGGGESCVVAVAHRRKRFTQVGLAADAAGNVAAGDQVIDQWEQGIGARVEFIEISDYGNASRARPTGGEGCRGCVVAVEMQCA